jgi:Na+-transporting NADH:ubiquinone oxidoreductase subunit NqrB
VFRQFSSAQVMLTGVSGRKQTSRSARALRGLLFAFMATLIGAVAHMAAGGNAPSILAIVLCTAIAVPAMVFLTARASYFRVLAGVAVTQLLFHWLFVWIAPSSAALTNMKWTNHAQHFLALTQQVSALPAQPTLTQANWMMTAAHFLAAVFTALVLCRADTGYCALVRALRWLKNRLVCPDVTTVIPPKTGQLALAPQSRQLIPQLRCFSSCTLRGPPGATGVVAH